MRAEPRSSASTELNRTSEPFPLLKIVVDGLERLGDQIDSSLARKPWLSIFVLAILFLVCTSVRALRRPLWADEILTRYVAALPSLDAIDKALAAHTESSPPIFHLVTKLSCIALGWNPLGLRFPAMAGYLAMILVVYFVVSRYAGPLYAAIGALCTYLTNVPYYASEARPYGLLLGLSCIALVCWQRVARRQTRWLALTGLWLSLAMTLGMHYYAVLSFFAIGLGELVRTWRERRIDWPVWAVLGFATAPLAWLLPLIRSNFVLRTGYFAPATISRFVDGFAQTYMYMNGLLFAALAVLAGACIAIFSDREAAAVARFDILPIHEVVAWLALLLAPVEAFFMGRFLTGTFVPRYAIVTIIGFSILLPISLHRLFRRSRGAALLVLFFLGLCFGKWYNHGSKSDDVTAELSPWLRKLDRSRLSIVIAEPLTYLPLAYSADRQLSEVLVYIPDPQEALKYRGVNSAEYNLIGLRGITPLNLPTYSAFTGSHLQFLVLWEASPNGWIVPKLRDGGAELRFCGALGERVLFLVNLPVSGVFSGAKPDSAEMICEERN